ncbi:hypothetical protein Lal_00003942 [Lupinus albus]|uniref:Hexosyltransferase n=1 Tax=Lupinus albus TaxID=3870 RepID=A0A6A4NZZ1_LUPAL|nr:putative glucuronosyltransferase [Lupinus albus]KAF1894026.1 hypothetical protein Lal_00003942 [Lupinus albus]
MGHDSFPRNSRSSSNQNKLFTCIMLVLFISLLFVVISVKRDRSIPFVKVEVEKTKQSWFEVIREGVKSNKNIKVGLVNFDSNLDDDDDLYNQINALHPQVDIASIHFDHVERNLKWVHFFPEWVDEVGKPKCPKMPMPKLKDYSDLNVVVARIPCGKEGVRDLFKLQVNLVVANLAVESGWVKTFDDVPKKVYVVFVGYCEPMIEIFRCDDLLMHQGEYWVYQPDLWRLKQQTLMPVGSCEVAPISSISGNELQLKNYKPKLAYVTILHSSEGYVCGAIALAQSIIQNKKEDHPIPDLVLLADDSIGPKSKIGLEMAGWKIKHIKRISNPYAKKGTYNEWNYSKLRAWQLTMYDKIIFMDADILLHKNIDDYFVYPELSVGPNDYSIFNSGFMIIEPSQCTFDYMMEKVYKVKPYNGGDQGFLNEVFIWWHRLPWKLNVLKFFIGLRDNKKHELPEDANSIHYFGSKPWMCYRDYDCNWDIQFRHMFASDEVNKRWWKVHDAMPKELQYYCGLTKKMNEKIIQRREDARKANFFDWHWKIQNISDPRRVNLID